MKPFPLLETAGARDANPRAAEWLCVGASALVVAALYCSPIFATWSNWGILDWDQHLAYHAVPYVSVVEYGQFPLWNPYACGGMVMHANPQSRVLSPFFPLHLLFGFLTGIKIEIVAHVAIGIVGAYTLARHVLGSRIGAAVTAAVFMLSGMYAHALTSGMTWFTSVAYVPWGVLGFVKSAEQRAYAWLTGVSLAFVFLTGGAYVLSITMVALFAYAIAEAWQRREWNPFVRLATSAFLALGLGAVKFFPSISFMHSFPRHSADYSGYSVVGLATSLFDRELATSRLVVDSDVAGFWRGSSYDVDENHMYVGPLAGLLFLLGIRSKLESRSMWLVMVLATLWLSLGNRARPSLWWLVHELPIYDSMRVAQRFRIAMMLGAAILCGSGAVAGVHWLSERIGPARARLAGATIAALLGGDLVAANHRIFAPAFMIAPAMNAREPEAFRQMTGTPHAMLPAVLRNVGTVDCYESAGVPTDTVPFESHAYAGEAFLSGTTGRAELVEWTPNRLRLRVAADGPGYVIVNQHAYPGWGVEQGNAISTMVCRRTECRPDASGVLAIRITPQDEFLDVVYRPSSFLVGAATSSSFFAWLVLSLWAGSARGARVLARFRR
jgi:hypothetical protein